MITEWFQINFVYKNSCEIDLMNENFVFEENNLKKN